LFYLCARLSTLKQVSFNILIALSPCSFVHWRLMSSRIPLSVCCSPICTRVHPYLLTCECLSVCVCVCVCVCVTHDIYIHTYIHTYIKMCVCVCVCVRVSICLSVCLSVSIYISTNLRRRRTSARVIKSGRVSSVMPMILYLASAFVVCSSDREWRGCAARCLPC
jgi:hypothetical protein